MDYSTGKVGIQLANGVAASGTDAGALNVHDLDNHRRALVERFLWYSGVSEFLSLPATAGDVSISVVNGPTYVEGNEIKLGEGNTYEVDALTVTDVTANILTLDRPLDSSYTTAAKAEIVSANMAVDGTLENPMIFQLPPPANETWHIDRMLIVGADGAAMDDGKFIGNNALKYGMVLRENRARGTRILGNWKTNRDIRLDCYNLDYSGSAPAGENGMNGRWTFKSFDIVIELVGADGDTFQLLVQDSLSANTYFSLKVEGHFAGDSFA